MNVQECYKLLKGNYEDAKSRLMTDRLIEKFMLKFPQDPTMQELQSALAAEDYELAFRSAHTLKGVAANLAFSDLQASASELTEQLRYDKKKPDSQLVSNVEKSYALVMDTLKAYQDAK